MELSESIHAPNLNHEELNLELGVQSSSSKSDLDPPQSDLDYTAGIEEELRNLDLREAEERDSIKEEEDDQEDEEEEESESDDNTQSKTEVLNENESETENGNQMRKRYAYPVRPEAEDCAYYMKTGTCKFGSNCKFNHPVRRKNQAAKEKVQEREELIERPGQGQSQSQLQSQNQSQIECKYYLRTGGCKFGKACRYNHTRAKSTVTPILELNFLGLPIRPGEKECPYYMRNGSCKYAANCRFNHPDPTAVGGSDSPSGYGNGGASLGSRSSPRALNEPAPFVPMMFSPTRGVPSQNSEWNGYQAPPLYPPERSVHSAPTYVMNSPVIDMNVYTNHQPQMLVDEFPERPGQPECSYFLKTGDCKYKSNCKYHHPKNRSSKSPPCTLSDKGLPLRPGQNICTHYSRYGICKFGPACKFDHPIHPAAASAEYELELFPSFGDSATRHETGIAGTGNGNGSDNKIQQPV